MDFFIGLIIGLGVGSIFGVFTITLLISSKYDDSMGNYNEPV